MRKIILSLMVLMICFVGIVSAATVVTLNSLGNLTNASYSTSGIVYPNYIVIGANSTYNCQLYTNENSSGGTGTWRSIETMSNVANYTNTSFTSRSGILEKVGIVYYWDVLCNSSTDPIGDWGGNSNTTNENLSGGTLQYGVDTTSPSITINGPSDASWDTDGNVYFNNTIVDNNAAQCKLFTLLNASTNTTGNWANKETKTYANNTWFNFTFGQTTNKWTENNTGVYKFYITCNDSAAQSTTTNNYTFYIDTIAPDAFNFNLSLWKTDNRVILNNSKTTDYTPQIGWNKTTELNFSYYSLQFFNGSNYWFSANITNIATTLINMTTLIGDYVYTAVTMLAYDVAGNSRRIDVNMTYSTASLNRELKSGWNIISNVGNNFTLLDMFNWSGATTVSYFNSTHGFESYVDGGSYGGRTVNAGDPVLLYFSANTNFSDSIYNVSRVDDNGGGAVNISNQSSSDWNLIVNRNSTTTFTLQQIDSYINCGKNISSDTPCGSSANNLTVVDYMSFYNNTAPVGSKYIPFVANWSINNATPIQFGQALWVHWTDPLPQTGIVSRIVNWTLMR